MRSEIKHIGDLVGDPVNARKHPERNLETIQAALHEVGAARSIVIDEGGRILAGNGVVEAAGLAGIEKVKVVDADGDTIVAVRRSNLTEEQKRRLALFDNRAGEQATWNPEILLQFKEEGLSFEGLFYDNELDDLLKGLQETQAQQKLPDQAPPPEKYMIVIECATEADQSALLERFLGEGLECRALMA